MKYSARNIAKLPMVSSLLVYVGVGVTHLSLSNDTLCCLEMSEITSSLLSTLM